MVLSFFKSYSGNHLFWDSMNIASLSYIEVSLSADGSGDHSVSSSAIVLEPLVQGLCGRHNNRLRHPPANGSLCFDQLCLSVRISVCYIKKILWWGVGVVSKVILRATSSTSLCSHLESLQLTDQTSHSYVYLKLLLSSLFARAVYSSFADSWFWLPCWSSPNWLL